MKLSSTRVSGRLRCLPAALGVAVLLLCAHATAGPGKLIGGPGYTFWRSSIAGQAGRREGIGRGIGGMGAYEIGDHVRITSGILHAEAELDDHTVIARHLFFAGLRGALPLSARWYASAGAEVGASRLKLAEALGKTADGAVKMGFSQRWGMAVAPVVSVGFRPRPKYHLELNVSAPMDRVDGGWEGSFAVTMGLYFWMGAAELPRRRTR